MRIYRTQQAFNDVVAKRELCLQCYNTRTFTHWDEHGEFLAQCPYCVPACGTPAYTAQQASDLAERCIALAFADLDSPDDQESA